MERLFILLAGGAILAAIAPVFDRRLTSDSDLRQYANAEVVWSLLLLFISTPAFYLAGTSRAFVAGGKVFWFCIAVTGLVWLVLSLHPSFGSRRAAKLLFIGSLIRLLVPVIGWGFSAFSIHYYRKAMRSIDQDTQHPVG